MLYLILKKKIDQLKYAGFLLLVLIILFLILLSIHFLSLLNVQSNTANYDEANFTIESVAIAPSIFSIYCLPTSFFTSFASLKSQSTKNGLRVTVLSLICCFLVFVVSSSLAFGIFGSNIKSNMLLNITQESGVIPVSLQLLFLVIAVIHIPIIFFNGKEAIMIMVAETFFKTYSNLMEKDSPSVKPITAEMSRNNNSHHQGYEEHAVHSLNSVQVDHLDIENAMPHEQTQHEHSFNDDSLHEIHVDIYRDVHAHASHGHLVRRSLPLPDKTNIQSHQKEYLKVITGWRYYAIIFPIYITITLLSIVVGDVKIFFGILGSTVGCFMIFAGPGTFYVITVHKTKSSLKGLKNVMLYAFAWLYIVIGYLQMAGMVS